MIELKASINRLLRKKIGLMKKVYFVQIGVDFGDTMYLPYAAGAIIASCLIRSEITDEYSFPEILHLRSKLAVALERIQDPYMVAFSCNIWNIEYNKALAKLVKQKYPDCLINFGGHSVGHTTELLESESYIDILTFGEGEPVFPELLNNLKEGALDNTHSIAFRKDGVIYTTPMQAVGDLKEYPSPYTMGIFDSILKAHPEIDFSSILETNRGCPYSCAFCDWTHGRKMRFFPEERIKAEILWMAENHIEFCYGIDSNFGMFNRDLEITDFLVETNKKYGFPKVFRTNYEKNSTDRVFRICNTFNSVGMDRGATVSYQTLNPEALVNIGRKNLTLEHFSELMRRYKEAGIATYSELILGFPGETYESFCQGICTLLEMGQHSSLFVYLCELLPHAAMAEPDYIKKHHIRSIKVYFKNAHSKANSNDEVHEYSHLVRATDTMDEDDWVKANLFSTCVQCFHSLGLLRFFAVYLHNEKKVNYFSFYSALCDFLLSSKGNLGEVWRDIKSRYDNSLKGNWHYFNPLFGDITWTYEEGVFLEAVYSWEDSISELMPFLKRFDISADVFNDLLTYQKMIIRIPEDEEKLAHLHYNLPQYFEETFEKNEAKLRAEKIAFQIQSKREYDNWKDYARHIVWYGRRKESTIYHKQEYYVQFEESK